jgi:hypothetical protein
VKAELSESDLAEQWQQGAALTVEQAVEGLIRRFTEPLVPRVEAGGGAEPPPALPQSVGETDV